ncbi:hypothetical protein LOD99_1058 [Oopsacas minuta]|uniref:Pecanex-like protein n=1 Tax=Oopsacas minuta TaxID=111878 RepID=A0AAV7K259_9METZ|nr:hypothetical protein LOD99_1058 [Oopsacas minuta]
MPRSNSSSSIDSSYQTDFNCIKFWCRVTETCTSGLCTPSHKHPFMAFIFRISVFLAPLLLATPFLALLETPIGLTPSYWYFSIGYGLIIFILVTTIHSIVWVYKTRNRARTADINLSPQSHSLLADYINSLFPERRNIFNLLVQGLLSGVICTLALAGLLPSQLRILFDNFWILFFILGWLAVSLAQFNLSSNAPIETAVPTKQSHSILQTEFLSRPTHVLILLTLAVILAPFHTLTSIIFYSILCSTPLLWLLGLLPPFNQFIPVLSERCVILLFGGTALTSQICVVILCVVWWVYVYIVSIIQCDIAGLVISGLVSYLLSLNLFSFCIYSLYRIAGVLPLKYSELVTRIIPYKPYLLRNVALKSPTYWLSVSARYFILPVICLSLLPACHIAVSFLYNTSICQHTISDNNSTNSTNNISVLYSIEYPAFFGLFIFYGIISLLSLLSCYILSSLQNKTILCNTLNNPLYPANVYNELDYTASIQNSWRVRIASISIQIIREYISRAICITFLGFFLHPTSNTLTPSFLFTISVVRSLHLVWRAPLCLSLHISIVVFIDLCVTYQTWINLSVGVHLLIIGWYLLTYQPAPLTYIREEKNCFVLLSLLLLPFTLLFLPISTLLTLTLIPIFTLPVFIPTYPHMTSFWPPQSQHSSWGVKEAVFYEETCSEVCKIFKQMIRHGVILSPSCGQIFLIRYEDRIIVLTLHEVGYQYICLSYRGLELEATSCHDIEATQIDDILEMNKTSNSVLANLYNKYLLYLVTPLTHAVINTYSEAKNSLRPTVNSKHTIQKCEANFPKCFAWLLIREVIKLREDSVELKPVKSATDLLQKSVTNSIKKLYSKQPDSTADKSADLDNKIDKLERTPALASYRHVWSTGYNNDNITSDSISEVDSIIDDSTSQIDLRQDNPNDLSFNNSKNNLQSKHSNPLVNRTDISSFLPYSWIHPPQIHNQSVESIDTVLIHKYCSYWKDRKRMDLDWSQIEYFIQIITNCVSSIVHPSKDNITNKLTGTQICKNYEGQFPWSEGLSWLTSTSLLQLAIIAYRYTLKLTTDEIVLMEDMSYDSLLEYLLELDTSWYIGCISDGIWKQRVLESTSHLFLLSRSKKGTKYYNYTLTLKPQLVHVASLQPESLHGMWSSQLFELLYLKNEEEERYSVQQEEHILRNISTQAGDYPIGYPVFSSAPLYI